MATRRNAAQPGAAAESILAARGMTAARPFDLPAGAVLAGAVYGPMVLLLAVTAVVGSIKRVPLAEFVRDVTATAGVPFYTGALSSVGVLLWCATASMCLLAGAVTRRRSAADGRAGLLLAAGLLTAVLMLDDLFLIHEEVAPRYVGVPGKAMLLGYGVMGLLLAGRHRLIIRATRPILLLSGLSFFAASIGLDALQDSGHTLFSTSGPGELHYFLEDGCKLLGIAGWSGYFGLLCLEVLSGDAGSVGGTGPAMGTSPAAEARSRPGA